MSARGGEPIRAPTKVGSIIMLGIIGNNFHILAATAGAIFTAVVLFVFCEDALHRRRNG